MLKSERRESLKFKKRYGPRRHKLLGINKWTRKRSAIQEEKKKQQGLVDVLQELPGAQLFSVYDDKSGSYRHTSGFHLRKLYYCVRASSFCHFFMHTHG